MESPILRDLNRYRKSTKVKGRVSILLSHTVSASTVSWLLFLLPSIAHAFFHYLRAFEFGQTFRPNGWGTDSQIRGRRALFPGWRLHVRSAREDTCSVQFPTLSRCRGASMPLLDVPMRHAAKWVGGRERKRRTDVAWDSRSRACGRWPGSEDQLCNGLHILTQYDISQPVGCC